MDVTHPVPPTMGPLFLGSDKAKKYHPVMTLIAAGMPVREAVKLLRHSFVNDDEATNPTLDDRELLKAMAEFRARTRGETRELAHIEEPITPPTVYNLTVTDRQDIMDLGRYCSRYWGIRDEDIEYARRLMVKTPGLEDDDTKNGDEDWLRDHSDDTVVDCIDPDTDSEDAQFAPLQAATESLLASIEEEQQPSVQVKGRKIVIRYTTTRQISKGERVCENYTRKQRTSLILRGLLLSVLCLLLALAYIAFAAATGISLQTAAGAGY